METNSQRQEPGGWWQRRVERVQNYFCSKHFVDPMPAPPWEVNLLFGALACGLMGAVWLIQSVW